MYLWHREAQLRQLGLAHQRNGDSVGQDQVAVDYVLDQAVRKAAGRLKKKMGKKRRETCLYTSSRHKSSQRTYRTGTDAGVGENLRFSAVGENRSSVAFGGGGASSDTSPALCFETPQSRTAEAHCIGTAGWHRISPLTKLGCKSHIPNSANRSQNGTERAAPISIPVYEKTCWII